MKQVAAPRCSLICHSSARAANPQQIIHTHNPTHRQRRSAQGLPLPSSLESSQNTSLLTKDRLRTAAIYNSDAPSINNQLLLSDSRALSMQRTSARGALSPTIGPTDPYAEAHIYYGGQTDASVGRSVHRTRTLSSVCHPFLSSLTTQAGLATDYQQATAIRPNVDKGRLRRRASHGTIPAHDNADWCRSRCYRSITTEIRNRC